MKKIFTSGFYLLLFLFAGVMASCGDDDDDNKGDAGGGGGEEVTVTYPAELTGLWYAVSSKGSTKTETGGSSWTKEGCTHWYELQPDGNGKLYMKPDADAIGVQWYVIDGKLHLRRLDTDELTYPGSTYALSNGGKTLTVVSDYVKDGATVHQEDVYSRTRSTGDTDGEEDGPYGPDDGYVPAPKGGLPSGPLSGVWAWTNVTYGSGNETEGSDSYQEGEVYLILLDDGTAYMASGLFKCLLEKPFTWKQTASDKILLTAETDQLEYTFTLSDKNNTLSMFLRDEEDDWERQTSKRVTYWPEFTLKMMGED